MKLIDIDDKITSITQSIYFQMVIKFCSKKFHSIIKEMWNVGDKLKLLLLIIWKENSEFLEHNNESWWKKSKDKMDEQNKKFYSLIFNVEGDYSEKKTIVSNFKNDIDDDLNIDKNKIFSDASIISNTFDLKNITVFYKFNQLCTNIELFIKKDFPLVIKYPITNLGFIFLFISSINEQSNSNFFQ